MTEKPSDDDRIKDLEHTLIKVHEEYRSISLDDIAAASQLRTNETLFLACLIMHIRRFEVERTRPVDITPEPSTQSVTALPTRDSMFEGVLRHLRGKLATYATYSPQVDPNLDPVETIRARTIDQHAKIVRDLLEVRTAAVALNRKKLRQADHLRELEALYKRAYNLGIFQIRFDHEDS